MSNTIYNPAGGATIYTTAGVGTASGEFTGHKIQGGAVMKATSADTPSLDGVALGRAAAAPSTNNISYRGFGRGISAAFLSASYDATMLYSSGGYCAYSGTAAADNIAIIALSADTWVSVNRGSAAVVPGSSLNMLYSPQKISAVNTTTGIFVTSMPYKALYSGQVVKFNVQTPACNWNTQTAGQYIVQRYPTQIAGVASTVLNGGGNAGQLTRSIHKVEAVSTTRTLLAMRAGSYNRFTGKWKAVPTLSSDGAISNSTITSDEAANPSSAKPGELCYKTGRPAPWTNSADGVAYSAKTTW